jgi:hypothetical protein
MNKKPTSAGSRPKPAVKRPAGRPPVRGTDLSALFNVAAQTLAANQSALNQADTENQNHGDNMVQAFNMIAQTMASQRGSAPSSQLRQAGEYLAQNGTSGSAQVYAQGLAQAAQQFQGQKAVTPENAMLLIQSLFGGEQAASPGGDLLGTLLGGGQAAPQAGSQQEGIDLGDLLNAGMTFMNARQQGQDNLQAALTALMSAGPMAQKPHRQQSGQLVANALLQAISGMAKRK